MKQAGTDPAKPLFNGDNPRETLLNGEQPSRTPSRCCGCINRRGNCAAKYKAELSKRETAAGTMVFEVNYGTTVEVELASAASKPLSDKVTAAW